jgi:hypothetical protein
MENRFIYLFMDFLSREIHFEYSKLFLGGYLYVMMTFFYFQNLLFILNLH